MNRIIRILGIAALVAGLASCSVEDIIHPSADGIAKASSYQPEVTVDQELNQVTFALPKGTKGVIPVWMFQDSKGNWAQYTAQDGFQKIFTTAGDYPYRMYILNANGLSEDYVESTFHVDNSIVNYDKYYTLLCGGSEDGVSKEWRIDNSVAGHMGCGEPGTTGTNWWSAQPDEKAAVGLYDNRMTFAANNFYDFEPGEAGTIYVNTGYTDAPYGEYNPGDGNDFTVPVEAQHTIYAFTVEGSDLYIHFPEGTLWPYIPFVEFNSDPRLKVESITSKAMNLIADNGGIAWHFTLTSAAAEQAFTGFKYNADSNFWKPIDDNSDFEITSMYYAHGAGWEAYPDGTMTYTQEGPVWTVDLPGETNEQWQAQFHIQPTSFPLSSSMNYDFSCIINSSTSFNGVTIKLTDNTDDGNFLFAETVEVKAYEDYVFYLSDLPGIDAANTKLVFDFGHCGANTNMVIKNIVLKDHAVDDGTKLPEDKPDEPGPAEEGAHYGIDEPTNLWRSSNVGVVFWYADGGWGQIADPAYEWLDGDKKNFKVTIPDGIGGSEWMGQTHFTIDCPASADKLYDFCVTLNSTESSTCTVKLAWEGNDTNHAFFYRNDVALTAYEDMQFKMPKIAPDVDYDRIAVFIDLGRTPAGAEVKMTDFCFQEHIEPQGGDDASGNFDINGEGNLWRKANIENTFWYSAADWSGALAPEFTANGFDATVIVPEGIGGSEWQGQTWWRTDIEVDPTKSYDFCVTLNSSEEAPVTIKLAAAEIEHQDDNDIFFYKNDFVTAPYEDCTFTAVNLKPGENWQGYKKIALIIDLGRCPAGTEVTVKDICFQEHNENITPEPEPEEPVAEPFDYNDPNNMWRTAVDAGSNYRTAYYYAPGWNPIADPMFRQNGSTYTYVFDVATSAQWQAQAGIVPSLMLPVMAGDQYDFSAVVVASTDVDKASMQIEGIFYQEFSLKADQEYVVRIDAAVASADWVYLPVWDGDNRGSCLWMDFGGNRNNCVVKVKDIVLKPTVPSSFDIFGEGNLWRKANITNTFWYSAADWAGTLAPEFVADGFDATVTIPEGIGGSEWQGQTWWRSDISVDPAKSYDFCVTLTSTEACVCTAKLAAAEFEGQDNNDFLFYDGNIALEAGKPFTYKATDLKPGENWQGYNMIAFLMDFGRSPAGSRITVSNICFQEHK